MNVNATRRYLTAFLVGILLAGYGARASGEPCCIILVPAPPPPPAPEKQEPTPASSYGPLYSQLPLLAAIEKKLFVGVEVSVQARDTQTAMQEVGTNTGKLGIAAITDVAAFNARSGTAKVQVVGIVVNRIDYGFFSGSTGPASIAGLKGQQVALPAADPLGYLYLAKVLRGAGLTEKDVKVVVEDPKAFDATYLAKAFGRNDYAALTFDGFKWGDTLGKVRRLTGSGAVTMPSWVLYSGKDTLSKEPMQVMQFLKGIEAGLKAVKGDPQLAGTLLGRLEVGPGAAKAITQLVPVVLPDSVKPNVPQLVQTMTIYRDIGYAKNIPSVTDEASLRKIYGM